MHETALVQDLVKAVEKTIRQNNIKKVNSIALSVGTLSNALPDALIFAFEAFTHSGLLKGTKLIIKEIPVKACCEACGQYFEPDGFPFACPEYRGRCCSITQGEEIYIESLDCEI